MVIERIVIAIDPLNSPSKESSVLPSSLISISRYSNLFQLLLFKVSMSIQKTPEYSVLPKRYVAFPVPVGNCGLLRAELKSTQRAFDYIMHNLFRYTFDPVAVTQVMLVYAGPNNECWDGVEVLLLYRLALSQCYVIFQGQD